MLGHNITEFINEEIAASVNGLKLISGQDIPADYTHDEFGSGLPTCPMPLWKPPAQMRYLKS